MYQCNSFKYNFFGMLVNIVLKLESLYLNIESFFYVTVFLCLTVYCGDILFC